MTGPEGDQTDCHLQSPAKDRRTAKKETAREDKISTDASRDGSVLVDFLSSRAKVGIKSVPIHVH
jgi:hypothetical protein